MRLAKWVLLAAALEIGGVGLVYLFAPEVMMRLNGMGLDSPALAHTIRAAYGGGFVAFGALFLAGALGVAPRRVALWALVTFMGGFAMGRLVSFMTDGAAGTAFIAIFISEIVLGGLALWLLASGKQD